MWNYQFWNFQNNSIHQNEKWLNWWEVSHLISRIFMTHTIVQSVHLLKKHAFLNSNMQYHHYSSVFSYIIQPHINFFINRVIVHMHFNALTNLMSQNESFVMYHHIISSGRISDNLQILLMLPMDILLYNCAKKYNELHMLWIGGRKI